MKTADRMATVGDGTFIRFQILKKDNGLDWIDYSISDLIGLIIQSHH